MLCVKECISFVWKDINGIPEPVAADDCNLCSHCLAVCPRDAISHEGLDPLQIRKIDADFIDPRIYETIARGRRSIRRYKDKKVPDKSIEKIIRLANHTPTASNSQHVGYIIISDKNILDNIASSIFTFAVNFFYFTKTFPGKGLYKLMKLIPAFKPISRYIDPMQEYIDETKKGRDLILHNAPVLILVHAPKRSLFSKENCNIAAGNIMNYAYASGLGTCYIGFLNLSLKYSRKLRSLIQLPAGRMVYSCMVMGYPAYQHSHTASRKKAEINWIR